MDIFKEITAATLAQLESLGLHDAAQAVRKNHADNERKGIPLIQDGRFVYRRLPLDERTLIAICASEDDAYLFVSRVNGFDAMLRERNLFQQLYLQAQREEA